MTKKEYVYSAVSIITDVYGNEFNLAISFSDKDEFEAFKKLSAVNQVKEIIHQGVIEIIPSDETADMLSKIVDFEYEKEEV